MLLLLLKSSACLVAFMVFYKLFLEKESFHHFKRFYLLGALLVSIGIPFITFTQYIEVEPIQNFVLFQSIEFSNTETITPEITTWQDYIPTILWGIYFIGVILFSFRFVLNLRAIFHRIKTNPKHQYRKFTNVLLQDLIHPHTFFKYIFLNKTRFENNLIPNEVLLHEQTHANQKHALDIILIEILQIVFWFNPLIYLIKKDIKLNHEFLADQAVIDKGISALQYKETLLAFSSHAKEPELANAINYSSIKKRFTVMKTQTSKQAFWLRGVLLLPMLAILIYSFSEKTIVEKEVTSSVFPTTTQQIKTNKGATEAMMKEYKEFIIDSEKYNMIVQGKLQRAKAIYNLMTDTQRVTVKKYPKTPPINLAKVKPKTPTETVYYSWKNKTKFAIWIDGKVVDNSELNNYSSTDFKYYTSSFVYNNARTEKHPQPYQNHLYTKRGFEASYLKYNVTKYNKLKTEYLKVKKEYINSNKKDDSELLILKAQLDKSHNSLSKEEIDKYEIIKNESIISSFQQENILKQDVKKPLLILINNKGQLLVNDQLCKIEDLKNHLKKHSTEKNKKPEVEIRTDSHTPKETITKVKAILREFGILKVNFNKKASSSNIQKKATPEEIAEYNSISKKYNILTESQRIIKQKELYRIAYIHNKMTKEQEANAEPFPTKTPPPPLPPYPTEPKNSSQALLELKKLYDQKANTYQEAVQQRLKEKKGKISSLILLALDAVKIRKKYVELAKKESTNIPPPPPPTPALSPNKKVSQELLDAKKEFDLKGNEYGKAVSAYLKEKKGNVSNLKTMYKEVMTLYDAYIELAKEEEIVPPPPPPTRAPTKIIKVKEIPSLPKSLKGVLKSGETIEIKEASSPHSSKTPQIIEVKEVLPPMSVLASPTSVQKGAKMAYNILTVPQGKEFQITLSDGTKIFLKSETKLKYPLKFIKGETRKVELVGEAFFDVASNKDYDSNFIVITNGKEINVSGKELIKK